MILPHKHPILLVDNHNIIVDDEVVAKYTVPSDHPVFEGHFPHVKIWPGVYLIEGMNQTAGLHALNTANKLSTVDMSNIVTFVTSVDRVKFRQPVFPGDKIQYSAKLTKRKRDHMFYDCAVYRDSLRIAQATVGLTAKSID